MRASQNISLHGSSILSLHVCASVNFSLPLMPILSPCHCLEYPRNSRTWRQWHGTAQRIYSQSRSFNLCSGQFTSNGILVSCMGRRSLYSKVSGSPSVKSHTYAANVLNMPLASLSSWFSALCRRRKLPYVYSWEGGRRLRCCWCSPRIFEYNQPDGGFRAACHVHQYCVKCLLDCNHSWTCPRLCVHPRRVVEVVLLDVSHMT